MKSNPLTVTFLFTDLEGSTRLWDSYPGIMPELARRHDGLLRAAIEGHRGRVVKTTGDGFHAVFDSASDATKAALAGQMAILEEAWPAETGPLLVRMGVHTGESRPRDGDYYGSEVNRAARLMSLAYGGQILVSEATFTLVRSSLPSKVILSDLGRHRLRGLAVSEQVYQLEHPALPSEFPPLKSLSTFKHNLPVQLTTFVGREQELSHIEDLLQQTHLLTLLGPGGTGKTRLMLEVAEEVVGDFRHGVWLAELAPLTDPALIPERVAAALTVQEQPDRPMKDALVDYLRPKELLLLLDNVEHLVQECAELAEYLLTHCPKLKILVTGREALSIGGEITLQIPSLSLPSVNGELKLDEIGAAEGVRLFLARAQEFRPEFELNETNAGPIAEIVRRLDGIPLAIELAAARLRVLSVDQIADRLNDRFRLLTGGRRTALPRQQTLQAMIDWSWNLLDEKERLLLQRLSVFSGGWTLDAAQAVVSDELLDEYDILDLLEQLANKSLVIVHYPAEGEARYGMLESIRQYGLNRLFESGEGAGLRDRHADYYVAFAKEAGPHLLKSTMLPWVARIRLELDNLRAVLAWTSEARVDLALRIAGSLLQIEAHWLTPKESLGWLEPAVAKARDLMDEGESMIQTIDFIRALIALGVAYAFQGNDLAAKPVLDEAAELARSHGELRLSAYAFAMKYGSDFSRLTAKVMEELEQIIALARKNDYEFELVLALGLYGMGLNTQGEFETARPYLTEAIELSRKLNNPRFNAGIYRIQAVLAQMQGNFAQAKSCYLLAIENYAALDEHRRTVGSQSDLAHMLRQEGKLEEAEAHYRQSIIGWQELGQQAAVAHQVECFAYIAIARGEYQRAAKLLGAARSARQQLNAFSKVPYEIEELQRAMEQLSEALGGQEERHRALAEGSLMSLDDAVLLALDEDT